MKRSSVSPSRLYATLVGPSLALHLSCSEAVPASHLGNTTYLIRLMNFGGVSVGLGALLCGDSVTTDYILGEGIQAAGRPVLVAPLTEVRCLTVWVEPVSGLLLLNGINAKTQRQACCTGKHKLLSKTPDFDLAKGRPIELNMIDCDTGRAHKQRQESPW